VLAVATPWYVWVGLATEGEFLQGFFLKEHFGRASTAMENHSGSPLFYPVALLFGFFPWSVFAVPLLIDLTARFRQAAGRNREGLIFAACWVGVVIGAFTLAATKLPSYVTVCYPALALLAGGFADRWARGVLASHPLWERAALACLAAVGVVIMIGLPLASNRYLPGEQWLGVIGVIPLLTAIVCWLALRSGKTTVAARSFAGGAAVFVVVLFGIVTGQVSRHQQSLVLLDEIASRSEQASIASFGCLESTWVYYAGQPIRELPAGRTNGAASDFVRENPEPFILTTDRSLAALQAQLPDDFGVLAEVPYFLKKDRLVLVGRTRTDRAEVARSPRRSSDRR
jgi:4-amino-4-deoxy-L-arabinose transferase-like glycosyltransferase